MKILVDSCCDLSGELRKRTQAAVAPLTITIDGEDFVDDGSVDIPSYLAKMSASKETPRSSIASMALRRAIRVLMVRKLVSMPPSQRLLT